VLIGAIWAEAAAGALFLLYMELNWHVLRSRHLSVLNAIAFVVAAGVSVVAAALRV
jgi:hypothetical protein